jgi:site-specific DNA-methyltransferase (adenine-specific)
MSIELLNMDCMDYMRDQPDNAFDLAIVDPPYGIGEDKTRRPSRGSTKTKDHESKLWDSQSPGKEYFKELGRVSENQIIWGANHFSNKFNSSGAGWIVWNKMPAGNTADCELAFSSFMRSVKRFDFLWEGFWQGDMKNKEKRIHPTQKPVKLYDWLLANYAKKGDRILDTHLGSGSSAIAAHYGGYDFVGMELDQDYYKAACERFDKETAQTDMFCGAN